MICGDSLSVMEQIPDCVIDCVVTDPPYGLSNEGALAGFKGGKPVEKNWKWDQFSDEEYDKFTEKYIAQIARVLKNGRLAYIWCGDLYAGVLARIGKKHGLKPKCILIAKKFNASPSWRKNNWRIVFETCLLLSKGPLRLKNFNFLGHAAMENYLDGTRPVNGRDLHIEECVFPVGEKETDHDCEKPVTVIRPLIEASTNPGDIVLDCFAGSGTTLVLAKLLGRHYVGIEREVRWVEVANTRLSQEVLYNEDQWRAAGKASTDLWFNDEETDEAGVPADGLVLHAVQDTRADTHQEKPHGGVPQGGAPCDPTQRGVPEVGEGHDTTAVGAGAGVSDSKRGDVPDWLLG
jgi:DNA modification methylase